LIFGGVIGGVATDRIRDDFNREVDSAAQTLAADLQIVNTPMIDVFTSMAAKAARRQPRPVTRKS
jgi:hypothetical protein